MKVITFPCRKSGKSSVTSMSAYLEGSMAAKGVSSLRLSASSEAESRLEGGGISCESLTHTVGFISDSDASNSDFFKE